MSDPNDEFVLSCLRLRQMIGWIGLLMPISVRAIAYLVQHIAPTESICADLRHRGAAGVHGDRHPGGDKRGLLKDPPQARCGDAGDGWCAIAPNAAGLIGKIRA